MATENKQLNNAPPGEGATTPGTIIVEVRDELKSDIAPALVVPDSQKAAAGEGPKVDPTLPEPTKPEEKASAPEGKDAPAKGADKKDSEDKKDDDKKDDKKKEEKPIPSGIKPRGFILPTLAVLVMAVPIVALCLPVFLTARAQRRKDDDSYTSVCALFPFNSTAVNSATLAANRQANERDCPGALLQQENEDILYNDSRILQPNNFPVNVPPGSSVEAKYFVFINLAITSMDHTLGQAVVSATTQFGGAMTDLRGRLQLGTDYSRLDVLFYSASGADASYKSGDRAVERSMRIKASADVSLFSYPFDKYNISIPISAHLVITNSTLTEAVPVIVKFRTSLVGYTIKVYNGDWTGLYELPTLSGEDTESETYLDMSVIMTRSSFVRFFAVLVLVMMWVLTSFAFTYAFDMMHLRPRNATLSDATLFTGLLFAMNGIRNAMPNVPPVGVGVDYYGFIWIMIFLMLGGTQVYCKLVAQYVHAEPTLYDKVAKTEAYTKWLEKKEKEAKEKAEQVLKDKESADKAKGGDAPKAGDAAKADGVKADAAGKGDAVA